MQRRDVCRWLAAMGLVGTLPLAGASAKRKTQAAKSAPLLMEVSVYGGFRPNGPMQYTLVVRSNGQTQVNGKAGTALPAAEVQALSTAIKQADFQKIRAQKGSGTRPSAYDGLDIIYTFHTPHGPEKVNNWDTKIDPAHPLFQLVEKLRQKYQAKRTAGGTARTDGE